MNIQEENSASYFREQSEREQNLPTLNLVSRYWRIIMKALSAAVFLALLAAWLHGGQGDQTCDKKSGPCYCEGSNISKIDVEGVLKDSM